jgi:hypothetical protein
MAWNASWQEPTASVSTLRATAAVGIAAVFALAMQQPAVAADCVTISKPSPAISYTYQHVESTGRRSQYTQQWEALTETGSRVRITRPEGSQIQVNEHHLEGDVVVLDKTSKLTAAGSVVEATVFRPGIVSDPAFRICAGGSWPIPSVTASFQSGQTRASARSPAGTLKIVTLRERVRVPAGQFDTVRYTRTSQSRDEYWKSIEHGIIVKHVGTLPNFVVTEELISIR